MMKKSILLRAFLCFALLNIAGTKLFSQAYKISSNNLVTNSTFNGNPTGAAVPNWSFAPAGKWNKENNLIYGEDIVIDALGTYTATPAFAATPCAGSPKVVRFFYNEENIGPYAFNIKLGSQTIASFSQNGQSAQSNITIGTGNTATIDRKFLSEGTWNQSFIWNNIWHQVEIYIPNYTGGTLVFEYVRNGGISRKVRLDNVELYEAIPTPVPTQTAVNLADCSTTTYNLNNLLPANSNYTYTWYTKPDPVAANVVSVPAAAPVGSYYLYATPTTSCANNTTTVSYPSSVVTVSGAAGCCGAEQIKNGGFDGAAVNGSYSLTSNTGIPNWTVGGNGAPGTHHIVSSSSQVNDGNAISGNTIYHYYTGSTSGGTLTQTISQFCNSAGYTLTFDLAVSRYSVPLSYNADIKLGNILLFNVAEQPSGGSKFGITNIAAGVTVKVGGVTPDGTNTQFNQSQLYNIVVTIPDTVTRTASNSDLYFYWPQYYNWYLDNVSLKSFAPVAQAPLFTTRSVDCSTGYYNLYNATPSLANYSYEWYTDAAHTTRVTDPSKVTPGTYYLLTKSACSGCTATSTTSITVNNSACVNISGKIFADYDGAANGVSTTSGVGQSAGMYAMLVNSVGNVVAYTKVKSDGTYTINSGTSAATNYVKISTTQPTVGAAAPAYTTLTPNYVFTSASAVGNTNYATGANGTGTSPALGVATSISGVNFGLNSPPIAGTEGGEQCALAASTAYTVPALYGVDDDPTWSDGNTANGENGTLQKVNIKTFSQTNGVLTYNGTPVTPTTVIPSYNPALLVFTSGTAGASSFNFTYTFTDAANAESREVGTVSYSFVPNPTISGLSTVAVGGTRNLTGSITPGFVPTAWTSSNPAIATVDPTTGVVTGVAVGTTTITYTDYIGCSGTMTMNVIAAACLKPATTDAGNTYPSKTAVTILTHTASDNWPGIRQSAHIVMEGNNYGFVPNRVANPETTITTPKVGMMVYDTTANCLKVNIDGTPAGWKCLTTQTCPN